MAQEGATRVHQTNQHRRTMTSLTIQLPPDDARRLREIAERQGASPEQFVERVIRDHLKRPEHVGPEFDRAARAVVEKNIELYRRLA